MSSPRKSVDTHDLKIFLWRFTKLAREHEKLEKGD
jgi:hypothetical protein